MVVRTNSNNPVLGLFFSIEIIYVSRENIDDRWWKSIFVKGSRKKVLFLVVSPLRRGRGSGNGLSTKEKVFFFLLYS